MGEKRGRFVSVSGQCVLGMRQEDTLSLITATWRFMELQSASLSVFGGFLATVINQRSKMSND